MTERELSFLKTWTKTTPQTLERHHLKSALAEMADLRAERDEARAEIERLRQRLRSGWRRGEREGIDPRQPPIEEGDLTSAI